jgi:hypothetical protein
MIGGLHCTCIGFSGCQNSTTIALERPTYLLVRNWIFDPMRPQLKTSRNKASHRSPQKWHKQWPKRLERMTSSRYVDPSTEVRIVTDYVCVCVCVCGVCVLFIHHLHLQQCSALTQEGLKHLFDTAARVVIKKLADEDEVVAPSAKPRSQCCIIF